MTYRRAASFASTACCLAALVACSKPDAKPLAESAPPPSAAAAPAAPSAKRFAVQPAGSASILIDAPLEKIKGDTAVLGGAIDVPPTDLLAAKGEVTADLSAFTTHTFGDKGKDDTQTEHARNWFELGGKVPEATRKDYTLARFLLKKVVKAEPASLALAKEEGGKRKVTLTVEGAVRIHGREAPKTLTVDVTFTGPADAPTGFSFATKEPFAVSLSEHDVKPRDEVGAFLNGALEKVGKKIDDKVQVTVAGEAMAK